MNQDMLKVTPAGFIPYTEKTFNEFKERLAATLLREALDTTALNSDEQLRNFIINYSQTELLSEQKDAERIENRTNIRLSNMVFESGGRQREFPVVNEYKNHHLMRVRYFRRNGESVEFGVCEVLEGPKLIVPNQ